MNVRFGVFSGHLVLKLENTGSKNCDILAIGETFKVKCIKLNFSAGFNFIFRIDLQLNVCRVLFL